MALDRILHGELSYHMEDEVMRTFIITLLILGLGILLFAILALRYVT